MPDGLNPLGKILSDAMACRGADLGKRYTYRDWEREILEQTGHRIVFSHLRNLVAGRVKRRRHGREDVEPYRPRVETLALALHPLRRYVDEGAVYLAAGYAPPFMIEKATEPWSPPARTHRSGLPTSTHVTQSNVTSESALQIDRIGHLVLIVQDIEASCAFYTRVLGMERVTFGEGRTALAFGQQKINLHQAGHEFEPKAARPAPGSADLCFITRAPLARVMKHLSGLGVPIEEGPVPRTGALRPITSVYIRDPDGNLIEIANELPAQGPAAHPVAGCRQPAQPLS